MNINLKLSGVPEQIVDSMIAEGYATSKTEAIRLAILSFRNRTEMENELVVRKMKQIDDDIKTGKEKTYHIKELVEKYPEFKELV